MTAVVREPSAPVDMFSRERLAGYDPDIIGSRTVLVVGVGALGEKTACNLSLSGVGELRVVDHDLFELHNRTRSQDYPTPHEQLTLGLEKACIVASHLGRSMTSARPRVRFAVARIQDLGLGAFHGVDAIVSCVDNPRARAYLADAARLLRLSLIEGGFDGPDLSLSYFPAVGGGKAAKQPCWRCSHQDLEGAFSCRFTAERAAEVGVIPAIQAAAATLGGLQTEAVLMALHPQDSPLAGHVLDLNIRTGRSRLTRLVTDPACPGVHRSLPRRMLRLTTAADDTIGDLLAEAGERLSSRVAIRLRDPFVLTAHCSLCGVLCDVAEPTWRWSLEPLCVACGGGYQRASGPDANHPPHVFSELDHHLAPEVLRLPCHTFGIRPLDRLEGIDPDLKTIAIQVNGALDDIFESSNPTQTR